MKNNKEAMKLIEAGMLIKDSDGDMYLVFSTGTMLFGVSTERLFHVHDLDIKEVRKPCFPIKPGIMNEEVWNKSLIIYRNVNTDVFLGISYQADFKWVQEVTSKFGERATLYDDDKTLYQNNEILKEARSHCIIPPAEFAFDHIIGKGLYCQYLVRKRAGKDSHIYDPVSKTFKKIKLVYKLQGDDNLKHALVVF